MKQKSNESLVFVNTSEFHFNVCIFFGLQLTIILFLFHKKKEKKTKTIKSIIVFLMHGFELKSHC